MTDTQWEQAKAAFNSQAHEALAMAAAARKNYDVAFTEFKTAIALSTPQTLPRRRGSARCTSRRRSTTMRSRSWM